MQQGRETLAHYGTKKLQAGFETVAKEFTAFGYALMSTIIVKMAVQEGTRQLTHFYPICQEQYALKYNNYCNNKKVGKERKRRKEKNEEGKKKRTKINGKLHSCSYFFLAHLAKLQLSKPGWRQR